MRARTVQSQMRSSKSCVFTASSARAVNFDEITSDKHVFRKRNALVQTTVANKRCASPRPSRSPSATIHSRKRQTQTTVSPFQRPSPDPAPFRSPFPQPKLSPIDKRSYSRRDSLEAHNSLIVSLSGACPRTRSRLNEN